MSSVRRFIRGQKRDEHADLLFSGVSSCLSVLPSQVPLIVMARPRRQSELPGAAELYARLLAEQGGECAIRGCKRRPKTRKFHIDHDHLTGRVRGLLCHWHNRILPKTAAEALALADYLASFE